MSTPLNLSPQQINTSPQNKTITGVVERLTFYSQELDYTVARLIRPRTTDLTTIVGSFANIQPGQTLQLTGFWRDHPQFGPQFQVVNYRETKPATITGIEKYLGSGLIKGVGPVTAKRIVAHFGLETLDIIENQIERLVEVQGIAKKRIKLIQTAWASQKAIKEVMVFLQGHGVSTTYAVKIYKQYKDDAITTVHLHQKLYNRLLFLMSADLFGLLIFTVLDFHNSGHRLTTDAICKIVATTQFSYATEGKCIARTTVSILSGLFKRFSFPKSSKPLFGKRASLITDFLVWQPLVFHSSTPLGALTTRWAEEKFLQIPPQLFAIHL